MNLEHRESRARHSRRRAIERFNLAVDKQTLTRWRRLILDGSVYAFRLSRWDCDRPWYAIWHGGEWVPVVYDWGQGAVVTVLPRDVLARFKRKLPW